MVYTSTRHPYADIPGQPHDADRDLNSNNNANQSGGDGQQQPGNVADASGAAGALTERPRSPPPDPSFTVTQHEIAQDVVLNMARIGALIDRLPGIGSSEREQVDRMAELDRQLREVEAERAEAVREKERLLALLDERIVGVRRP